MSEREKKANRCHERWRLGLQNHVKPDLAANLTVCCTVSSLESVCSTFALRSEKTPIQVSGLPGLSVRVAITVFYRDNK